MEIFIGRLHGIPLVFVRTQYCVFIQTHWLESAIKFIHKHCHKSIVYTKRAVIQRRINTRNSVNYIKFIINFFQILFINYNGRVICV